MYKTLLCTYLLALYRIAYYQKDTTSSDHCRATCDKKDQNAVCLKIHFKFGPSKNIIKYVLTRTLLDNTRVMV